MAISFNTASNSKWVRSYLGLDSSDKDVELKHIIEDKSFVWDTTTNTLYRGFDPVSGDPRSPVTSLSQFRELFHNVWELSEIYFQFVLMNDIESSTFTTIGDNALNGGGSEPVGELWLNGHTVKNLDLSSFIVYGPGRLENCYFGNYSQVHNATILRTITGWTDVTNGYRYELEDYYDCDIYISFNYLLSGDVQMFTPSTKFYRCNIHYNNAGGMSNTRQVNFYGSAYSSRFHFYNMFRTSNDPQPLTYLVRDEGCSIIVRYLNDDYWYLNLGSGYWDSYRFARDTSWVEVFGSNPFKPN